MIGVDGMPSRMDNRASRKQKYWFIIAGLVLIILFASGYFLLHRTSTHNTDSAKNTSTPSSKSIGHNSKKSSTSAATSSSNAITSSDLVGLSFSLSPVLYNGENVDTAMNAGRAPLNTIHDGAEIGYFKTASTAFIGGVSATFYAHDVNYSVSSGYLQIDDMRFKLELSNGNLVTQQYEQSYSDGNVITWELKSDPDAKTTLDEREAVRSSSSQATDSNVDQKNLTSAQLEHWVRSVIKSGSQAYTASDYTFKQAFVDGYAQIEEFTTNPNTNKEELLATFRVNGDGQLEMENDNTNGEWTVASSTYY